MKKTIHIVSVSGGKDSTATLLLALNRVPKKNLRAIFCDTGNEHEETHRYLDTIEQLLGIHIERRKADFSVEIANKRKFIANDQRVGREYDTVPVLDAEGNPVPKRDAHGNPILRKVKKGGERAVLHPTGNPYLDLCLWKGRFPSRIAQFCTEELKRNIAVNYQLELIDAGFHVISWQGIRRDESLKRRSAKKWERIGPRMYAFRPVLDWTALDIFAYCKKHNVPPNPLYLQGAERVGCMPCINCGKAELRGIASRWPEHIERIATWEKMVSDASKRGFSTFVRASGDGGQQQSFAKGNILQQVQWSKTSHGGRQYDLFFMAEDSLSCSSAYGLCE